MNAVSLRLRAELRGKWRGWLGLVLLVGAFGGATLATAAGARRTDTAYPRFLRATHPYDQFLLQGELGPGTLQLTPAELRTIPQVADVIEASFFPRVDGGSELIGSADPRLDHSFNTVKAVRGRVPDPDRADEIGVPVAIAESMHLRVGDTVLVPFATAGSFDPKRAVTISLKVVGIIAAAGEFPPESDLGPPRIHLTPAFYRANIGRLGTSDYVLVWFHRGPSDLPGFRAEVLKRYGGRPLIGYTQAALTKNVERSFHLQAVSLGLFAACLAIVTMLVLGQALGRQALTESVDYPALRALGTSRTELFGLGVLRAGVQALAGIAIAVPVAALLSPLAPAGLARAAEPAPGFAFDPTVLGLGAAAEAIVLMLFVIVPALRAARLAAADAAQSAATERGSRGAAFAARAGAPASAVVGMRLALERGRGRTAVPVRTTILGVALAVMALVVSLGFGASLNHLLATPRLYGVTWGAEARFQYDLQQSRKNFDDAIAAARSDPAVSNVGAAGLGIPFLIDGVQADAMAIPANDATFLPPIQEGSAPRTIDEIVLGPKTLSRIHRRIGDRVQVGIVGIKPIAFTIVGRAVVPTVGHTANLGEGSLVVEEAIEQFHLGGFTDVPDQFLVRFRPGVDVEAARARLGSTLHSLDWGVDVSQHPADLVNFGRSRNLPFVLSFLLALLALATLAHAQITSINRRRRDLAILKTMGFTRGDTGRAVAWQSTTFIVVALALGISGGAAAGRWLWTTYANGLGIIPDPRVPVPLLAGLVPSGILVANALALVPARSAARTRPALVLRTE